jgi:hypothetical protein
MVTHQGEGLGRRHGLDQPRDGAAQGAGGVPGTSSIGQCAGVPGVGLADRRRLAKLVTKTFPLQHEPAAGLRGPGADPMDKVVDPDHIARTIDPEAPYCLAPLPEFCCAAQIHCDDAGHPIHQDMLQCSNLTSIPALTELERNCDDDGSDHELAAEG